MTMMSDLITLFNMPWLLCNELKRYVSWPIQFLEMLIWGIDCGDQWKFYGSPIWQKHRGSMIKIGNRVTLRSNYMSNPLAPEHPVVFSTRSKIAKIVVGDDFGMTGGSVVAMEQVQIGNRVMVGANSLITDTDFHPLESNKRRTTPQAGLVKPVKIGDDVFIGAHAIILKGSEIGSGSVIGAGSVVSGKVPKNVVVAGNPWKVVKQLKK